MDSKVVFKKTARLAVTAGLAASMTLGSFPLAVFADATEPEQKSAVEQEAPKAGEAAAEEQAPAAEETKPMPAAEEQTPKAEGATGETAPAADAVAEIGDMTYTSLAAAVKAAKTGDTIKLIADTKLDTTVSISNKITIDGQGHRLNGQLAFRAGSDNSKVQKVHFVFDKDTKFNSGDWASSIRIQVGNNIAITNNQFTITKDSKATSRRAVGVCVFPTTGVTLSGTKIENNTFFLETRATNSSFGVFVTNESNDGKITDTVIKGNVVKGKDGAIGQQGYFLGVYDKKEQPGITGLTIQGNNLSELVSESQSGVMEFYSGAQDVRILGNTFGTGDYNIYFYKNGFYAAPQAARNSHVEIGENNTFNGGVAVYDKNGIEPGTLSYVSEQNTFGPATTPYKGHARLASFAANFYINDVRVAWQTVEHGRSVAKPEEKPGYITEWYKDKALKKTYDFSTVETEVFDGTLDLYGNRTPIEYKVTYDLNGGVNAKENPSTFTVESGVIKLAAPTRDGYDFAGWVDADGKKIESLVAGTVGDVALKATWTKKAEPVVNHTVTFVDGLGNKTAQTVSDGGKAVAPTDPKHDGWEFLGWYTSEDFKELYDFDAPVAGDLTLYGGWRKTDTGDVTEPDGEEKPDTQEPAEAKPADKKPVDKTALPQTGDDSALPIAVAAGAGVAAIAAGAVASKRRKQE